MTGSSSVSCSAGGTVAGGAETTSSRAAGTVTGLPSTLTTNSGTVNEPGLEARTLVLKAVRGSKLVPVICSICPWAPGRSSSAGGAAIFAGHATDSSRALKVDAEEGLFARTDYRRVERGCGFRHRRNLQLRLRDHEGHERVPRRSAGGLGGDSRAEHPTSNKQHRTSKGCAVGVHWMLDVRCWWLDVPEAMGAFGAAITKWAGSDPGWAAGPCPIGRRRSVSSL